MADESRGSPIFRIADRIDDIILGEMCSCRRPPEGCGSRLSKNVKVVDVNGQV
jgi:hypothetical protein